jgi:hypothetical protein
MTPVKLPFLLLISVSPAILVSGPYALHGHQSHSPQDRTTATRLKPVINSSKQTQYVSCWNKQNKLTGSRLVRTQVFISPDGSYRAYIEVEATAFQPQNLATYTGNLCENTSRLFLAGDGEATFKLVFAQSEEDFSDGNSLTLVDWSSDGRHLLLGRTQWKYESEGDYTDFVIFNVDSGRVTHADLEAAVAARYGKDCGSENSILGFTSDGRVVVAIAPLTDQVALTNGAKSCVKKKALSVVNLTTGPSASLEALAANFSVIRYGKFAESPPKQ